MLSRELMGLLALAVLWVNTLLVVAASWKPLSDLLRRLARMRALGVRRGEVVSEALAEHRVEQVGRRASDDADRQAVLFHDRRFESRIAGGRIDDGHGALEIAPVDAARAAVGAARPDQARAAACDSPARFDEAYLASKKARGFERTVVTALGRGAGVWVVGAERDGRLEAPEGGALLVAGFDPRRWCRRRALVLAGFSAAVLAAAALVTYLALYPPVFGTVSMVGGALGLAFFLLVQPAGTAVRDAVRVPSVAYLRGSWVKRASEGRGAPETPLYAD